VRSLPVHLAVHEPEHEDAAESAPIGERDGRDEEEEEGRKGQKGEEEEAANADVGLDASASEVSAGCAGAGADVERVSMQYQREAQILQSILSKET